MPSFAMHNICGIKLLDKLNVSKEDRYNFIIGNALPDVSRIKNYNEMDDLDKKKAIQKHKKITHFRKHTDRILQYPDCSWFLDKYRDDVKDDIISLAYYFHLYTDYYFYKYFFPKIVCFLDEDKNITNDKELVKYVKIYINNNIVPIRKFFDKKNEFGIYKEYSRCNKYLLNKYDVNIDCNKLIDFVDQNGFLTNIEETNSLFAYYAIRKLEKYVNDIDYKLEKLYLFNEEDLDNLIEDTVISFIDKHKELLENYM